MTGKLRLVVFTSGELTDVNHVLFERLARDPLLDLAAIVIDEYRPPRKPLLTRIVGSLRREGVGWLAFKVRSKIRSMAGKVVERFLDRIHGARRDRLEEALPVPVHRVFDIHAAESIAFIHSLSPDLGVIVGTRILGDTVITIPKYGTLNIHKLQLPAHRGGGPVGYWEVLAGERSIGVSIHYAMTAVDSGPILAQATIPIESGDTLQSLKVKADIRGAQLYHETLRRFAEGRRDGTPQDLSQGTTHRAPSEYQVWQLQRRLERQARRAMGTTGPSIATRLRVLAQYAALLPWLQALRRRLIRERRAPISIFFYHLVADSPHNHMCLPLQAFVRQIEFLRRYYAVLSLDETVERLRSGTNDEIAASITFDDGYRDNEWAIEYLRYHGIPATFFVSIGHVRDGSSFEHDRRRGYDGARPMSEADLRRLVEDGFTVGSHGVHHEDFGTLASETADAVLRESRDAIAGACARVPDLFAFPKGQRGTNITPDTLALALQHYAHVFSAYGGYSFPEPGRRHFLRTGNPSGVFDLALLMSGYTGFRHCLRGDAWGLRTAKLDPCSDATKPAGQAGLPVLHIALVAASPDIVGGHSVQARSLAAELRNAGHEVDYIAIDPRFPRALAWLRRIRYVRTLLNQALYLPSLLRIANADVVHVFSASYWSFLLAPAPAIIAARLLRKPVVLHYHSGEADDHLTRWRRTVAPLLRMVDEIVVPSSYLQGVFAAHGYRARVIQNVVDTSRFRYRQRKTLRPRLLSVRNLESYYDVENTVAAFAHVKTRFPDATLTIAGYGSHERALRQLTDQLGVTDVRFLGRVEPGDLPALYDQADIFLNSSVLDNQPVSILEAFAAGLPVVSTPTGDIASMLCSGEAGVLVEPRTPCAMTEAVTRLVRQPGLAVDLTRRAREEVERYTWCCVGAKWTSLYAEVMTGRSGTYRAELQPEVIES